MRRKLSAENRMPILATIVGGASVLASRERAAALACKLDSADQISLSCLSDTMANLCTCYEITGGLAGLCR